MTKSQGMQPSERNEFLIAFVAVVIALGQFRVDLSAITIDLHFFKVSLFVLGVVSASLFFISLWLIALNIFLFNGIKLRWPLVKYTEGLSLFLSAMALIIPTTTLIIWLLVVLLKVPNWNLLGEQISEEVANVLEVLFLAFIAGLAYMATRSSTRIKRLNRLSEIEYAIEYFEGALNRASKDAVVEVDYYSLDNKKRSRIKRLDYKQSFLSKLSVIEQVIQNFLKYAGYSTGLAVKDGLEIINTIGLIENRTYKDLKKLFQARNNELFRKGGFASADWKKLDLDATLVIKALLEQTKSLEIQDKNGPINKK